MKQAVHRQTPRAASPAQESRGTFADFLAALRAFESGIDPAKFKWYVDNYDVPCLSYPRVTAPGRAVRDWHTGALQLAAMTVREYFESLGVADLFDPRSSGCLLAMQYRVTNVLGFIGYQIGEAILITTGHYRPQRVRLRRNGVEREYDAYYVGGIDDATWRMRRRQELHTIPGTGETIVATDVNRWRGSFTGKGGICTLEDIKNPHKQEGVLREIMDHNYAHIVAELERSGEPLDAIGVDRTLSGLLAAAHLAGAQGTVEFLRHGTVSADEFGTPIVRYLRDFGGYATPYDAAPARAGLLSGERPLTEDGGLEHHVEQVLLGICRRILQREDVFLDRGFREQGGDSLATIQYVAGILRAFEVGLSTEAVLAAESIADVKRLILERIAGRGEEEALAAAEELAAIRRLVAPRQEAVVGPVPLIANRYSYFLRRRRNLTYWNVTTGLLAPRAPIDEEALHEAARRVASHHDALRLQLHCEGGAWRQVIVEPEAVDPLVTVTCADGGGAAFQRCALAALDEVQESFAFPGELFRVLHVRERDGGASVLAIVAHHLLVDAYAYHLVLGDLFDLYRQLRRGDSSPLPPKTTSFLDYSVASTRYWLLHAEEEAAYWRGLPWEEVRPLPVAHEVQDGANLERYTTFAVASMPVADASTFLQRFAALRYQFADLVLAAIAKAYWRWTRHEVLHLATVFHGRESFLAGVDLTRTAAWISETVPLLLPGGRPAGELLAEVHGQRERIGVRGKSYGVLRYLGADSALRDSMEAQPLPEVSLNIVLPGVTSSKLSDAAERPAWSQEEQETKETTERVFLLSGGVYFRDGKLHISWDFSSQVLEPRTVERFASDCLAELTTLATPLIGELC